MSTNNLPHPWIALFPHPYDEHKPNSDGNVMDWNKGKHQRKFIKCPGEYMEHIGAEVKKDTIMFWGEAEWPSTYEKTNAKGDGLPEYIHSPSNERRSRDELKDCQNTDPYVFGDTFYYSCCHQTKADNPTRLQELKRGDIILFYGSPYGEDGKTKTPLDTVFVVDKVICSIDKEEYEKNNFKKIDEHITDEYMTRTILPIFYGNDTKSSQTSKYILFSAATYDNPVKVKNGMFSYFSYFPCKTESEGVFARFDLGVSEKNRQDENYFGNGIKNFSNASGRVVSIFPKKKRECVTKEDAYNLWLNLTQQITDKGYKLGVRAYEPKFDE